jgi:hypothetical protein
MRHYPIIIALALASSALAEDGAKKPLPFVPIPELIQIIQKLEWTSIQLAWIDDQGDARSEGPEITIIKTDKGWRFVSLKITQGRQLLGVSDAFGSTLKMGDWMRSLRGK